MANSLRRVVKNFAGLQPMASSLSTAPCSRMAARSFSGVRNSASPCGQILTSACNRRTSCGALPARHQPCCFLSTTAFRERRRNKMDYMNMPPPYDDIEWDIKVGLCLTRPPRITQKMTKWLQDYLDVVDDKEDERAIPSAHDELMKRFSRLTKALEKRASGETVTEFTQQELTGDEMQLYEEIQAIEEDEKAKYKPADRETQDDIDKVLTSMNRCLDNYLYLVVRHKRDHFQWTFPQMDACGTMALHEEAVRMADTFTTPTFDYKIHSNAPSGLMSVKHATENGRLGSKVFVYNGLVTGDTKIEALNDPEYLEYRWLPKVEIKKLMSTEQFRGISDMLLV
ncbi:large ribosomal subunit protein mL46-like [Sycon ciliatum]|uniref:large ribosomal subunit protein mL46-like n=1 Tax=Sycon ciliatum TaxID=27933 RepID=UPI0020ABD0E4|eukprot:scpid20243/ scgid34324/ 39S ribosomal protein L46, mitochondrial